ncbi:MAG TPA: hypothetical protein VMW35_05480 [Myxococcota bacterium]|nr:hypothetical protein [Myxococcota bacterium]
MGKLIRWLLIAAVAFVALIAIASEFGGEVVTLRTWDSIGVEYNTHVWVVDDQGSIWVRSGDPNSGWLERLHARPSCELERAGEWRKYVATPVPGAAERINSLMAEKYGWADAVIGLVMDRSASVPVRLSPGALEP